MAQSVNGEGCDLKDARILAKWKFWQEKGFKLQGSKQKTLVWMDHSICTGKKNSSEGHPVSNSSPWNMNEKTSSQVSKVK